MKKKKKVKNSEDDVSRASPKGRRVSRAESSRRRSLETCGHAGSCLLVSLFLFVSLFFCLFFLLFFCLFVCVSQDLQPCRLVSLLLSSVSLFLSLSLCAVTSGQYLILFLSLFSCFSEDFRRYAGVYSCNLLFHIMD